MAIIQSNALEEGMSEEAIKSTKKKDKTKKRTRRAKDVVQTPEPLVEARQDEADATNAKTKRKAISDEILAAETRVEKNASLKQSGERKKKREHASGEGHDVSASTRTKNSLPEAGEDVKEKKKRKKEKTEEQAISREENASTVERESTDKGGRKDKKRQGQKEEPTTASIDEQPAGKMKEKRKKRKKESEDAGAEAKTLVPTGESEPKKKKRKRSKHGYPDPSIDEEISEQAKKALIYANVHAEEPETWKFNKARQNWLIRNIWSDAAIPDRYVSIVNRYLTSMQGGARKAFLKTCKNLSASSDESAEAVSDGVTPEKTSGQADSATTTLTSKIQRARVLLQLLESKETV